MDEQPAAPTLEEAWTVVVQICRAFQGNRADHERIDQALTVLSAELQAAQAQDNGAQTSRRAKQKA